MRTSWIHAPGRVWQASRLALSGGAAVLTVGAVGVLGAAPAQAGNDEGALIGVFVVQPTTTQVGNVVTPHVVVNVEFANGQLDKDYNGPVVLEYAVNRLGAPLPTGNEVNANCGVATFKNLAFSAVGFGFELKAVIPGQSEEPGPWPWPSPSGWSWMPWGSGMGQPSSPFDIVTQLLQCGGEPGSKDQSDSADGAESDGQSHDCTGETVSSDGTSGSATAPNETGTLESTGGGFPALSCTTAGGVVSFSSTLSKTITVSFAGPIGEHSWSWHKKSVSICWGSPTEFITKYGVPARFNPANGEFEGLLPHCGAYRPEPCVSSVRFGSWGDSVTATIQAPAGDPHMTF
jgi:hypothetical protein